ncbi:MAG: D-erythrose 4-phosphate dehydrogenase [Oleispira sp.]|jgi:erythrose-4-phosphate dehydrogenase
MIRIAINGFGRIGRSILRALYERNLQDQLQVVAINELADLESVSYMLRYDSTHGRFSGSVETKENGLIVNGDAIQVFHESEVSSLPWQSLGIDLVLECTGVITNRDHAELHLVQGAKRVLISHPAESSVDATVIQGFNQHTLRADNKIISNGSCSTNCLIPVLQLLNTEFGIKRGMTTTIHSAMNDQPVIDAYHSDLRRTRAAVQSIIPVETGLAIGIARLMPELANKFESLHMRVPTLNVSVLDVTLQLEQNVTVEQVNSVLKQATESQLAGILAFTQEPHASVDFNHDPHSGVVDATQTRVSDGSLVKLMIWFDNEWGFANRMLDTALQLKNLNPVK